jgi:hypothetical protein
VDYTRSERDRHHARRATARYAAGSFGARHICVLKSQHFASAILRGHRLSRTAYAHFNVLPLARIMCGLTIFHDQRQDAKCSQTVRHELIAAENRRCAKARGFAGLSRLKVDLYCFFTSEAGCNCKACPAGESVVVKNCVQPMQRRGPSCLPPVSSEVYSESSLKERKDGCCTGKVFHHGGK